MESVVAAGVATTLRGSLARQGLTVLGIVPVGEDATAYAAFTRWLGEGKHAGMGFLANHGDIRRDPRRLLDGARAAVVFAWNYNQGDKHLPHAAPPRPRIAQYARLKDYHVFLRKAGEAAVADAHAYARSVGAPPFASRVVTDSAPLLERALATRTAEGFIGKNTCYIHPRHGSWLLLAEIIVDAPLPTDAPARVDPARRAPEGGCGSCRRCQSHCPTGALDEAYRLDANLCLSYWTIENRGVVPERFWPWLPYYVYGCDVCQLVCPYNRGAAPLSRPDLRMIAETPDMLAMATMSQADYEAWFGGTPVTRAKRAGLRRNALIVLAVTRDPRLPEALRALRPEDEPVLHDTARQIAAWAGAGAAPRTVDPTKEER